MTATRRYTLALKEYLAGSGPRFLGVNYYSAVENKSDGDPMAVIYACKHAEEVAYLKKTNAQLKKELEAFLAPTKK